MYNAIVKKLPRKLIQSICAAAIACSGAAQAAGLTDSQVLAIYIQVNGFDIDTAQLARAQASSEAIRKLAAHVAADHLAVRQAAYALAEKCNLQPELPHARDAVAVEHNKTMSKFLSLKGPQFDKEYIEYEVQFHRAAIEAVQTALLPSAKCAELQAHFTAILPAFKHHLEQSEALAALARSAK